MEVLLTISQVLSLITSLLLPLSILLVLIGAILDFIKKKFHWSKFALIILGITMILLIVQIALTYQVTNDILNNS